MNALLCARSPVGRLMSCRCLPIVTHNHNHTAATATLPTRAGTLMLNTEGMSATGLQRKATCQALFSKMLYLTENEGLVAQDSEAFKTTDLRMVRAASGVVL